MIALTTKYAPQALADFIGLEQPKAILSRLISDPYTSAFLLLGPSGLGKTSIAFATAKAIGGQIHHIRATECTIDTVNRLAYDCHFTPFLGGPFHIAIVDEADAMSPPAQKAFLSILDGTASPPNTIFIFTANSTSLLQDRFLSRVRTLHFTEPPVSAIAAFLSRTWDMEKSVNSTYRPDFTAMVTATKGNIRTALMLLETELLAPGSLPSPADHKTQINTQRPPSRKLAGRSLKDDAIRLRSQGLAVGKIAVKLGAPASSVWRWTNNQQAARHGRAQVA